MVTVSTTQSKVFLRDLKHGLSLGANTDLSKSNCTRAVMSPQGPAA